MASRARRRPLRLRVRAARRPNPLLPVVLALAAIFWLIAGQARSAEPESPTVALSELAARAAAGALLLDVRTEEEWRSGHVPGARHVPIQQLPAHLDEIDPWRERGVVVYCESGPRARRAAALLREAGFRDVSVLDGSMSRWRAEGRPVQTFSAQTPSASDP